MLIRWWIAISEGRHPLDSRLLYGVERITQADRACAVAAAAAHDLNDDLTVILSGVAGSLETLEPGHPARPLLLDARNAVERCAWKTSSLLTFSARHGVSRVAAPMETLIGEE